jgi:hypothetical protein
LISDTYFHSEISLNNEKGDKSLILIS